jgi:hypothetical protein
VVVGRQRTATGDAPQATSVVELPIGNQAEDLT